MADDAKPMSQDDIDALLNALGGDASAPSRPAEPAMAAGPAPAVDQAELDLLIAALDEAPPTPPAAPVPAPAEPTGPLGQDDIDALINGLSGGAPAAPAPAPAAPSGPLGQDDIDALINGLGGGSPAPAAAPAPAAPSGPMGQDDIDALLNGLTSAPAPAPAEPTGPLGQDDIDALINGLGGGAAPAPAPAPAAEAPSGPLGQDDIDALINGLGGGAPTVAAPAPAPAVSAADPDAQLGQSDIDALVASLGSSGGASAGIGDQPTVVNAPAQAADQATVAAGESEGAGLSSDVVDALVAKHAAAPDEGGEGMIAQSDIDALVKSLGGTAPPGAPPAPPTMTEQLARHDDAIDQLLAGAAPAGGAMATMDAVDVRAELGKGSGPQSGPVSVRHNAIAAIPVDLRGARWMLLAAVLLLSVCCGTLVIVAGAVKNLASELKAERTANLAPTDNYGDDFKAALLRLNSPQDEEVAKGVLFLQRLKKRYPSHETEVGLELARHFRGRGSWREARREYAAIVEESSTLQDDPRVHLEYAEVLARVKERSAAIRQVNLLLANESVFTGDTNLAQLPRPAPEIATNRATLQEAQLLLGRLLAEDDGRRTVAAAGHGDGHAAHAPAHGEAAPAHGAAAHEGGHDAHGGAH